LLDVEKNSATLGDGLASVVLEPDNGLGSS
jgi:hypothetical protein